MKIVNGACPDSTYFRMSDVAPEISQGALRLVNGTGTRRSWGAPRCESLVLFKGRSLVIVFVGFCHKHGGGQGWFYFKDGVRVLFRQLSPEDKVKVLKAFRDKAPDYAKPPCKPS